MVEQSSHSALPGDNNLKHHILQHGRFCLLEKTPPERLDLIRDCYQLLSHQTPGKRLLDSHNTPTESTRPWLNLRTTCWPGQKGLELKQTPLGETAFQEVWSRPIQSFSHYCFSLSWIDDVLISISQAPAKGGNLFFWLWPFRKKTPHDSGTHFSLAFSEGLRRLRIHKSLFLFLRCIYLFDRESTHVWGWGLQRNRKSDAGLVLRTLIMTWVETKRCLPN